MKTIQFAVAAAALATLAVSTGCGTNETSDHSAHETGADSAAPASSNPATGSSARPAEASGQHHHQGSPVSDEPNGVPDQDCGPVSDPEGGTRTVIAVSTPKGRPGCTEAINVATEYAGTISTSDKMTVQGWQCAAQPDPATPSQCTKDGLIIALRAN